MLTALAVLVSFVPVAVPARAHELVGQAWLDQFGTAECHQPDGRVQLAVDVGGPRNTSMPADAGSVRPRGAGDASGLLIGSASDGGGEGFSDGLHEGAQGW
jgi:hypothetical protein